MPTLILNFDDKTLVEEAYVTELKSAFYYRLLSELGYDRMHKVDTLDKIRNTYNLTYDKLLIYKNNKKYKINFSPKQKKHGKLIDTEKEKARTDYDIVIDLKELSETGEQVLRDGIAIDKTSQEWSTIRNERLFLSETFKLTPTLIMTDLLMSELIAEQKNIPAYNAPILQTLRDQGYTWKKKYIECKTFTRYGNFISEDFLVTLVINKNPTEFLKAYAKEMLRLWVNLFVELTKDVTINIHYSE